MEMAKCHANFQLDIATLTINGQLGLHKILT